MNEFSWKGLSSSFLIDMKKGGDLYSMTTTWGRYAGVLEETMIGREGGIVGVGVMPVVMDTLKILLLPTANNSTKHLT